MKKKNSLHIVFIGAGNVATQLALALKKSNHTIVQVYSRQLQNAQRLAQRLKCTAISDLHSIVKSADLYIISVKDDAIVEVATRLKLKSKLVVHTSGSVDMKVLQPVSKNYGVFYPLQTFSKTSRVRFKTIPVCVEANSASSLNTLILLGHSISDNVQKIDSEQRRTIHLAAVIACNFTNHMYAIAEQILNKNKMSLDILKPLIQETTNKIKTHSPAEMQTGPAIRDDKKTMEKQLQLLTGNVDYQKMYTLISKSILTFSKNKSAKLE